MPTALVELVAAADALQAAQGRHIDEMLCRPLRASHADSSGRTRRSRRCSARERHMIAANALQAARERHMLTALVNLSQQVRLCRPLFFFVLGTPGSIQAGTHCTTRVLYSGHRPTHCR